MQNPVFVSRSLLLSRGAGLLTALLGATVLMGWWLGIDGIKSAFPGTVSMKANTACALVAAGAALLLEAGPATAWARRAARLLTALVLLVAGLSLAQYLVALDFGFDQWLFQDDTLLSTSHPGRMAPVTALGLGLIGAALLLKDRRPMAAQSLSLAALLLALLALVGYAFEVQSLYRISSFSSIAVHTAFALALLSLGVIAARPSQGFMKIMVSDASAGLVARRLLPLAPLLLFSLGWLTFLGRRAGLYDDSFALALVVMAGGAAATLLVLRLARRIYLVDHQHRQAQEQLAALNAGLEQTVAARTRELEVVNAKLMAENTERRRAEEEVRRLSLTDELTGLWNRRGFFVLAEQELKAARRADRQLALFYIDLDGLKQVNDRYGHETGDALLRDAAQVLKATFRACDIVSRLGGDEFAILAATHAQGECALGRLQSAIERFNQGRVPSLQLSFSIGVIEGAPSQDHGLVDLLAAADAMMYGQKQARYRSQGEAPSRPGSPRAAGGLALGIPG
ncbi:GGDEF domain-containing protein [Ramlibacter sp. 2FC]|uniref:GGDEF domain-containing protein n=1 Tax=Ramlibacter sp. 2FC TaxID=2502188 RepID=UPI0010F4FAD3|nr:GGDEF domain-containing protein [Ramlibacter sp. 2FC]